MSDVPTPTTSLALDEINPGSFDFWLRDDVDGALARLRRDYRFQFLLKAPRRSQLTRALAACLDFCAKKEIPDGAVHVDVDPVNLL